MALGPKRTPNQLSVTEVRILSLLRKTRKGLSGRQITVWGGGEPAEGTVWVLLGRLFARGYVTRKRAHISRNNNAISVVYSITPAGRDARKEFATVVGLKA